MLRETFGGAHTPLAVAADRDEEEVEGEGLESALAHGPRRRRRGEGDLAAAALVTQVTAFATGVPAEEIARMGRSAAHVSRARHIAMYLAHTVFGWPQWRVAHAFGRDRTTAGYACTLIESLRDDRAFDRKLDAMEACIRSVPASGALA
ncbi:helix-turn-helix domain-containing protein [soil metagenome]